MGFFLELDGCCCCCQLRTGSLVLLWITVSIPLLLFVPVMLFLPAAISSGAPDQSKEIPLAGILLIVAILSSILLLVVGPPAAALYGIYKRKPSFMFPVIVLNVISIIISILGLIGQIVMIANGKLNENPAGLLVSSILQLLIGWYFASVIYSYYSRLKEEVKPVPYGERINKM